MHGIPEPSAPGRLPRAHRRILVIMGILGGLATLGSAIFHSPGFGIGVALGCGLSVANYFWLRNSLRKIFAAARDGERPRVSALRYLGRYIALGAVIAVVFITGVLPVVAVILGMGAFAFAVVVDGVIRMFSGVPDGEVI